MLFLLFCSFSRHVNGADIGPVFRAFAKSAPQTVKEPPTPKHSAQSARDPVDANAAFHHPQEPPENDEAAAAALHGATVPST